MVLVLLLSLIVGALGVYYYFLKDLNFFKRHAIPHKSPLPLLGNMALAIFRRKHMATILQEIYDLNPDAKYVGFYEMSKRIVMLRDLELIKNITQKNFESFMDHRLFLSDDLDPPFGKNLFSLTGDRWKEVRSIMTPSFTSSKMKSMFNLMSECAVDFAEFFEQLSPEKRIIETKDAFSRYTNDMIATCAFGVSVDSMRNPDNQFYLYGKETTKLGTDVMLKFYMFQNLPRLSKLIGLRFVPARIADFFYDLIETTIRTRDEQGIVRPDMLQLMMESRDKTDGAKLSLEDMIGQAFSFFLGGFHSTSTLMCFAAHEIAINRDVHDRLQKEVDKVLEDTNGDASYSAINAMVYLDAVMHEALRMYPVGVKLDRVCVKDFELPPTLPGVKPFKLRKGDIVWIPFYSLHYDPNYYSEPEKFNPERFMGEQKQQILSLGVFYPFGAGPRTCIGNRFALLEMKVLFFHLLARLDLKPCEKTSKTRKLAIDGFNMKFEGGFWLKVEPRKNPHRTVAQRTVANDQETP